ncbi:hypothetical protein BS78_01G222800 [Paspalum vaginatum]|nr:hypothetical protein BS78_01G222800 [Paspalum vaginatum]
MATVENTVPPTVGEQDEVEVIPVHEFVPSIEKRGSTKLSNFNPQEDVCLVKAWLEISCDPVIGNGQKGESFWKRVVERYNYRRGQHLERTLRSLQSRWNNAIKPQVSTFSDYYAEALRLNPSGMSDADETSLAASNFVDVEGHAFGYMHCWDVMKDEPKWCEPTKAAGMEGDTSLDSNRVTIDADKRTGKRPIGRDRAKAANKKGKSSDTSSSDYASKMQDLSMQRISMMQEEAVRKDQRFKQLAVIDEKRYQETLQHNQCMIDIEKEKVKIMREKHDMARQREEKQEDERILALNLDECTPQQRLYYETLQQDIMEKIAARRQRRQGPKLAICLYAVCLRCTYFPNDVDH